MSEFTPEDSKWIQDHRCAYDIRPIVELRTGDRADVGFEVNLSACLPWEGNLTPEFREEVAQIEKKLREIMKALVPKESAEARFEIAPTRPAVRFPHGGNEPEVTVTVRVYHKDYGLVQAGDRGKFQDTEKLLQSLGFRRG